MVNINMNTKSGMGRNTIEQINRSIVQTPLDRKNITAINNHKVSSSSHNPQNVQSQNNNAQNISSSASFNQQNNATANNNPINNQNTQNPTYNSTTSANRTTSTPISSNSFTDNESNKNLKKNIPLLKMDNKIQRGQKVPLFESKESNIKVYVGWHTKNPECDVDLSCFMLDEKEKVIGDDFFVFYGQTKSPDNSITLQNPDDINQQIIDIDFTKIDKKVQKIVFVLTINEAKEKNLNFSMIENAHIKIVNSVNDIEIVSFLMDDSNYDVTSMMIGQVYLHQEKWKFNSIGNGVKRDLKGLCEFYGVEVV